MSRFNALVFGLMIAGGCASRPSTSPSVVSRFTPSSHPVAIKQLDRSQMPTPTTPHVRVASHQQDVDSLEGPAGQAPRESTESLAHQVEEVPSPSAPAVTLETLADLEASAVAMNPTLRRLSQEAAAARARVCYMDKLPDPVVGTNIFASPIETAAGSQRANMAIMQTIPSLARLDAQVQQACFDAMALRQLYFMERLRVIGDIRAAWYRLYVLRRQIRTTETNIDLLEVIVDRATSIVATGKGSASDVRLGTVELSRQQERLIRLSQQVVATQSQLNRLVGRPAATAIEAPQELQPTLPDWSHAMLVQMARENQPAIGAAQIRTQATRWGVEVARLQRRPNVTWNASWFAIDDNRPATNLVSVGQDAWSLGAQVSVPLWHSKYDAMEREARWRHAASHASVEEVIHQYDATLRELWEQARSAHEIAELYETTIVPEARRTLNADNESYGTTNVEFDRVIKDFQTLLTLQLGYDEAIGRLATALARIEQAVGVENLTR